MDRTRCEICREALTDDAERTVGVCTLCMPFRDAVMLVRHRAEQPLPFIRVGDSGDDWLRREQMATSGVDPLFPTSGLNVDEPSGTTPASFSSEATSPSSDYSGGGGDYGGGGASGDFSSSDSSGSSGCDSGSSSSDF